MMLDPEFAGPWRWDRWSLKEHRGVYQVVHNPNYGHAKVHSVCVVEARQERTGEDLHRPADLSGELQSWAEGLRIHEPELFCS